MSHFGNCTSIVGCEFSIYGFINKDFSDLCRNMFPTYEDNELRSAQCGSFIGTNMGEFITILICGIMNTI